MKYTLFVFLFCLICASSLSADTPVAFSERDLWIQSMLKISDPVLGSLSQNKLKELMPVALTPGSKRERKHVSHLEAFGRVVVGIAPWLELGVDQTSEGRLRKKYIDLTLSSLRNSVDPSAPDYLNFRTDRQALVDAAFLAQGLLRAPTQLWEKLDTLTQQRIVEEFLFTRNFKPLESNWLFFSAIIECALKEFTGEWNKSVVDYAFNRFEEWYAGDSFYGDGPKFHFDYYNGFVIHPMIRDALSVLVKYDCVDAVFEERYTTRFIRQAEIQERMISPEGSFPVVGRSMVYRFAPFQVLSQAALLHSLPKSLTQGQVRAALTAVIERVMECPDNFDENGWLNLGFCGSQPEIAEDYISTGSSYLCNAVFLALGLPHDDLFWQAPSEEWTNKRAWSGKPVKRDKALKR